MIKLICLDILQYPILRRKLHNKINIQKINKKVIVAEKLYSRKLFNVYDSVETLRKSYSVIV